MQAEDKKTWTGTRQAETGSEYSHADGHEKSGQAKQTDKWTECYASRTYKKWTITILRKHISQRCLLSM